LIDSRTGSKFDGDGSWDLSIYSPLWSGRLWCAPSWSRPNVAAWTSAALGGVEGGSGGGQDRDNGDGVTSDASKMGRWGLPYLFDPWKFLLTRNRALLFSRVSYQVYLCLEEWRIN
jgi:hypothetical protein